jgi:hypothetical protein
MTSAPSPPAIAWKLLWGITAVQAAVTLLWVLYKLYIPELLAQFGWPPQVGINLLLLESAIVVLIYPLFGRLSDRSQQWFGSRLPLIVLGVCLTSLLTIALPTLAIFGGSSDFVRQEILYLLVFWAIAMATFISPTLSLLQKCAPIPALPILVGVLTMTQGLIKLAKPLVNQFILSFGPGVTFALGSITLLAATALLRSFSPAPPPDRSQENSPFLPLLVAGILIGLGFSFDWFLRLGLENIQILATSGTDISRDGINLAVNAGVIILALPAGIIANRYGNRRCLILSLGLALGSSCLLLFTPIGFLAAISGLALAISLPFMINGGFALALSVIPSLQTGLGVGLYLGGGAAAVGLSTLVFTATPPLPIQTNGLQFAMGLIALILVILSPQKQPTREG